MTTSSMRRIGMSFARLAAAATVYCWRVSAAAWFTAGLLPQWTAAEARSLAAEVESALTANNWHDFLAHMWGSEPAAWRDDLEGWARLRVIVNAMTRMRSARRTA